MYWEDVEKIGFNPINQTEEKPFAENCNSILGSLQVKPTEKWCLVFVIEPVKDFAEKEGVKREISELGLTEREAQELIRQFKGKETDTRGRSENTERGGRGGGEISAIHAENGSEREGKEVKFSLKGTGINTKDHKKLTEIIEHLKGEFEVTKFAKADQKKLAKMTRDVLKEYSSFRMNG